MKEVKGQTRPSKSSQRSSLGRIFRIRKATVKDLEVLVRQRRGMWSDMGVRDKRTLDRVYRTWARKQLSAGNLTGWLVENRERRVVGGGCIWLQPVQPTPMYAGRAQPYLMSMYTDPGYRGKGVASLIVRACVEWSKKRGYPWMVLHASKTGRGLYRGLGFTRLWEMGLDLSKGANIDGIIPRGQRARSSAR